MATDRYDVVAITAGDIRWMASGELEVTTNPYGLRSWSARIAISGLPRPGPGAEAVPVIVETDQGVILVGSATLAIGNTGSSTPTVVSCHVHGTGDFSLI